MTTKPLPDPDMLARLLVQIGDALATADRLELHATGIALDTARLSVEDALAEALRTNASIPAVIARDDGAVVSRDGG